MDRNKLNVAKPVKLNIIYMHSYCFSVDSPMPGGHYISSNTMLKIKVELAHPLATPEMVAAKQHIETTNEVI